MNDIQRRKDEHIQINLEKEVNSGISTGFEDFHFIHCAVPEVDLVNVDTTCEFLGKRMHHPILISSMTGSTLAGDAINIHLAEAAQDLQIAMGVGSQRYFIETDELEQSRILRKVAPDIPLYANLGAIQLNYGFTIDDCQRVVDSILADALILHLNPLQEALQVEGQTNFGGLLAKIESVCKNLNIPVIIKEVGWGISPEVANALLNSGVSAIDVAGAGGTSWSEVEKHRADTEMMYKISSDFRNWGLPTAYAVEAVHEEFPELPLIASGGLRNGIDLAKSIALGASLGGYAGVLLKAATVSTDKVHQVLVELITELKIAMFAVGAKDLAMLSNSDLVHKTGY